MSTVVVPAMNGGAEQKCPHMTGGEIFTRAQEVTECLFPLGTTMFQL